MLELLLVLGIILLFIFPVPTIALILSLATTGVIYRFYYLLKNQPPAGRKNLWLTTWTFSLNGLASMGLGLALAFLIYILIADYPYLFLFNFFFCSAIAIRWFDFTHNIFRHFILKFNPALESTENHSFFVLCQGLKEGSGFGLGMVPVFSDAGFIRMDDSKVIFNGVFSNQIFDASTVSRVDRKSSEKIRIISRGRKNPAQPDGFLIVLKDRFYPFKCRGERDRIYDFLRKLLPV